MRIYYNIILTRVKWLYKFGKNNICIMIKEQNIEY